MGVLRKFFLLVMVGSGVFFGMKIHKMIQPTEPPVMPEPYWGPGASVKDDPAIKPFKINVSDKELEDFKARLGNHRAVTPSLENVNQDYGIHSNLFKEISNFWLTKYDWRQREKFLNKFPQFKTQVQGLNIHYIHVKPKIDGVKVVPLLLLHGWPGSVREFYEIIPLLTTKQPGRDFVFEVIAPSLPGYGFSDGAAKPGLGAAEVAVVFKNFMEKLGHKKYYLQGGDWGAMIVTNMAILFKERILGVHSNMCFSNAPLANIKLFIGSFYPPLLGMEKGFEDKVYPLSNFFYTIMLEMGYMHLQATKPDTVGIALTDSPAGLGAYILEKFTTWTNMEWKNRPDGGLKLKYKYEDLLDNVMIYWFSKSITTSMRLYAESFNIAQESLGMNTALVTVPSACAAFGKELAYQTSWILRDRYTNLVQYSHFKDGGHFAAFEVPKLLAQDIYDAVEKFTKL